MSRKKVQITLPDDIKTLLEETSKQEYMSVSSWIERAVVFYLEKKNIKNGKKTIDLGI